MISMPDIIVQRLINLKNRGFVTTLRRGDTGVGQTLEQYLGLTENNFSSPDLGYCELKCFRKETSSMLTLFTKEPFSDYGRRRDRFLLSTYGKDTQLYSTVSTQYVNSFGFQLIVQDNQLHIAYNGISIGVYWTVELLQAVFENKIPAILLVLADSRNSEFNEEFHYNEAYYLHGFSSQQFINAILFGHIVVDLRMHLKENGQVRNHGTAFRVIKSKLYECFETREKLI